MSDSTPGEAMVSQPIVRGEYHCAHGTTLWLWWPVGKVPVRLEGARVDDHYCDFELVSTEEEEWPG